MPKASIGGVPLNCNHEPIVLNITVTPSDKYSFGCRIDGVSMGASVDTATCAKIEEALNEHAVVCVSGTPYGPPELVNFSRNFGPLELNVAKTFHHGSFPQLNVLSNRIIGGKPEDAPDAGQVWHTDLSYNRVVGRASILHANGRCHTNGRRSIEIDCRGPAPTRRVPMVPDKAGGKPQDKILGAQR